MVAKFSFKAAHDVIFRDIENINKRNLQHKNKTRLNYGY